MEQLSPTQVEHIARAAHEMNRSWCELMGDHSHKPWEEAPEWAKTSARNGVLNVVSGVHSPEGSHATWLAEKRANGWTYGTTKDAEAKTHPCMVAYDQLPFEQQYKDTLFVSTVKALYEQLWRLPQ